MDFLMQLFLLVISLIAFAILIKIDYWIKQLRDISKSKGGYTKLVQLLLACFLLAIFFLIIIYYLIEPTKVDRIDIILTVVVGWLGAIIGNFFSDKSMDNLEENQLNALKTELKINKKRREIIEEVKKKLSEQLKKEKSP